MHFFLFWIINVDRIASFMLLNFSRKSNYKTMNANKKKRCIRILLEMKWYIIFIRNRPFIFMQKKNKKKTIQLLTFNRSSSHFISFFGVHLYKSFRILWKKANWKSSRWPNQDRYIMTNVKLSLTGGHKTITLDFFPVVVFFSLFRKEGE